MENRYVKVWTVALIFLSCHYSRVLSASVTDSSMKTHYLSTTSYQYATLGNMATSHYQTMSARMPSANSISTMVSNEHTSILSASLIRYISAIDTVSPSTKLLPNSVMQTETLTSHRMSSDLSAVMTSSRMVFSTHILRSSIDAITSDIRGTMMASSEDVKMSQLMTSSRLTSVSKLSSDVMTPPQSKMVSITSSFLISTGVAMTPSSQSATSVIAPSSSEAITVTSSVTTTTSTTPTVPTTSPVTTTLEPANYFRKVKFSLEHSNCSSLFTAATKDAFVEDFKSNYASVVKVPKASMSNFDITCGSIVVSYEQGPTGNLTAKQAEAEVKKVVLGQSFALTVDGETSKLIPNTYSSSVIIPPYATTTTPPSTDDDDDDDLSSGEVIGIVIAVFVVVIVIFVLLDKWKKSQRKRTSQYEMKGRYNNGYHTDA